MMLLPFNVLSTEPISDEPRDDPTKFGFSVTTSAKGGLDITIGFDTINVRKYMRYFSLVSFIVLFHVFRTCTTYYEVVFMH